MDKDILLATKTLVESIRHYIRDTSDVFSVCHAREWYIDKFPRFLLFFSKWPTSWRFVELSEDDIYHFCEQDKNVKCFLFTCCYCKCFNFEDNFFTVKTLNEVYCCRIYFVNYIQNVHIIKRTLHGSSKIWILCSRYCSCHWNIKSISPRKRVISSIYVSDVFKCIIKQ